MRTRVLLVAALLAVACTQTETEGVENAAGAIHKARPAVKGAAAGPSTKPRDTKNLDRAFDIEESKPRDTKNLDRAFDIEESKPANLNRSKARPGGATPGAKPGRGKTVPRG